MPSDHMTPTERTRAAGRMIVDARMEMGISQKALARRARVGRSILSRYECGQISDKSSRDDFERVAHAIARATNYDALMLLAGFAPPDALEAYERREEFASADPDLIAALRAAQAAKMPKARLFDLMMHAACVPA